MTIARKLTAAAAVLAIAGSGAAVSQAATTVDSVDIKGAAAYIVDQKTVQVVFRTQEALPRRASGMIRARGSLDGAPSSSLGTLRGSRKAANCYVFSAAVKNGKIVGPDAKPATVGSSHKLKIEARGTEGTVSDTITVTLTKKPAGERPGKRLGC